MTDRERLLWTIKANSGLENPEVLLAALEAAGYAIYRPDECTYIEVEDIGNDDDLLDVMVTGAAPAGSYRLVQVGGDS